ncbi:MAG: MbtH family protein [Verrucomicrobia bacterium]|nr:MAG: MbtH family protein [Verrucomicrobiota bacterium]
MDEKENNITYKVVVNHEEQYSIWPADRANAPGWRDVGKTGDKAECLEYIRTVWTDMRPLSLRKNMADASAQNSAA